jgi:hypothetical protein
MKKIWAIAIVFFCASTLFAQTAYYKGEWRTVNKNELFTGIFRVKIKDQSVVTGKLIWVYHATDSSSAELMRLYKDKKGKVAMEIVEGVYNPNTGDIYWEGIDKKDPQQIIGTDKYTLKLSADKRVIYGTTDSNGAKDGLFYGRRMDYKTGAKLFAALRRKIKG